MSNTPIPDHYGALGVPRTASPEEIKKAYRAKSRELHPDVNPGKDTSGQMQAVNEAYRVLSDPKKRAEHDAGGRRGNLGAQWRTKPARRAPRPKPAAPEQEKDPFNMSYFDDLLKQQEENFKKWQKKRRKDGI